MPPLRFIKSLVSTVPVFASMVDEATFFRGNELSVLCAREARHTDDDCLSESDVNTWILGCGYSDGEWNYSTMGISVANIDY